MSERLCRPALRKAYALSVISLENISARLSLADEVEKTTYDRVGLTVSGAAAEPRSMWRGPARGICAATIAGPGELCGVILTPLSKHLLKDSIL